MLKFEVDVDVDGLPAADLEQEGFSIFGYAKGCDGGHHEIRNQVVYGVLSMEQASLKTDGSSLEAMAGNWCATVIVKHIADMRATAPTRSFQGYVNHRRLSFKKQTYHACLVP